MPEVSVLESFLLYFFLLQYFFFFFQILLKVFVILKKLLKSLNFWIFSLYSFILEFLGL